MAVPRPPALQPATSRTSSLGSPIDAAMLIDALEEIVGHGGLLYLQHFGGSRFGAAAASLTSATKLVAQGLQLNNHTVALEQVGPLVTHVSVYRVPPYISDESLLSVLRQYGTISHVEHVGYRDWPHIGTGVVRLAIAKPRPNFIHVQGVLRHGGVPWNAACLRSLWPGGSYWCGLHNTTLHPLQRVWPCHRRLHGSLLLLRWRPRYRGLH